MRRRRPAQFPVLAKRTGWSLWTPLLVGSPVRSSRINPWHGRTAASRRVVWSLRQDELSGLHCHNESYRRLAGVAAVNRIDNVKTAVGFFKTAALVYLDLVEKGTGKGSEAGGGRQTSPYPLAEAQQT